MSGRVSTIISKRRNKKMKQLEYATAARASKKAKLSDVLFPESTVLLEPQLMCMSCSSKDVIDTNQLTITQWENVEEVNLGRDPDLQ